MHKPPSPAADGTARLSYILWENSHSASSLSYSSSSPSSSESVPAPLLPRSSSQPASQPAYPPTGPSTIPASNARVIASVMYPPEIPCDSHPLGLRHLLLDMHDVRYDARGRASFRRLGLAIARNMPVQMGRMINQRGAGIGGTTVVTIANCHDAVITS